MGHPANAGENSFSRDATVSMAFANGIALFLLPITFLLFLLPYQQIWTIEPLLSLFSSRANALALLTALILGVVFHELLHAVGFLLFGKAPASTLKFGFSWKGMAPYAHCHAPIRAKAYRISVWLPGILLGIMPGIMGLATGSGGLTLFGTIMTIAAGGDLAVIWAIRSVPANALVLDHPSKPGCQLLQENPAAAESGGGA